MNTSLPLVSAPRRPTGLRTHLEDDIGFCLNGGFPHQHLDPH